MDDVHTPAYDYGFRTPSPKRRANDSWSDRLVPSRAGTDLASRFALLDFQPLSAEKENARPSNASLNDPNLVSGRTPAGRRFGSVKDENSVMVYDQLLRSELLGMRSPPSGESPGKSPECQKLFQYRSVQEEVQGSLEVLSPLKVLRNADLPAPRIPSRSVERAPFKVLDAPGLQDDFYLNLTDWSSTDDLAVALGHEVYISRAGQVSKICDLGEDSISSIRWSPGGSHLAVGTLSGQVQIWDKAKASKLRTMKGHKGRVCALAWNGPILSTGAWDGRIVHRDVRQRAHHFSRVQGHKETVCGLHWSPDEQQLASGSEDHKVRIWNLHSSAPVVESSRHTAAVKALSWSPHQAGLLASGGGNTDRCIRLWNTTNNVEMKCVDTGSQVCNLLWSGNVNEIVSTHGYSTNEIVVWKCPSMSRIATLSGHTGRVLQLCASPDGRKVATGAGDLSIRIWDVFPARKPGPRHTDSLQWRTIR